MGFKTIGFIGCGSMGGALALAASKRLDGAELLLANRHIEKAEALALKTGGHAVSNTEAAEMSDLIFLGVKPQFLADVVGEISPVLAGRTSRFILVSMITGVTSDRLAELFGGCPVIRIMPNTPCAVGEGMIQFAARNVTDDEKASFLALMADAGEFDELDEGLMDAASAVSGAGPAFLCLALEGMADGGVALGLPRDKALKYAAATMKGLGALALETGDHPGVMKDRVTSPGGTTIQGVRQLERGAVRSAYTEAVIAVFERTRELKKNI